MIDRRALFIGGPLDGRSIAVPSHVDTFHAPEGVNVPDVWAVEQEPPTDLQPGFVVHTYTRMLSKYDPSGKLNVFEWKGLRDNGGTQSVKSEDGAAIS